MFSHRAAIERLKKWKSIVYITQRYFTEYISCCYYTHYYVDIRYLLIELIKCIIKLNYNERDNEHVQLPWWLFANIIIEYVTMSVL